MPPTGARHGRSIVAVLAVSYLFWFVALPCLHGWLIVVSVFPPLVFAFVGVELVAFLVVPLVIAAVTTASVSVYSAVQLGLRFGAGKALLCNFVFLLAFVVFADLYKAVLMAIDARGYEVECIESRSFLESVRIMGEYAPAHGLLVQRGVVHIWSYSERRFVVDPDHQGGHCGSVARMP